MVTGDNILTAVSVSWNCGLLPVDIKLIRVVATLDNGVPSVNYHLLSRNQEDGAEEKIVEKLEKRIDIDPLYQFALDGSSFEVISSHYSTELLPYIVQRGAVFARMRPDMKQQLVETLQDLGYFVGMCGDGANDCGALKAAHSGISLSEAEASVASPFTSKTPDISCVPVLIKEGRAALVTSFGIFKYMAGYSITQFVSVMILYEIYSNLSDTQYLYIDLFIITTLAGVFGLNRTYDGPLANRPPENSLISVLPLFSLLSQLSIVIGFQVAAYFLTTSQSWFVGFDYENPCYNGTAAEAQFNQSGLMELEKCDPEEDPVASYENYSLFVVSQFQYIILAIAFAKGSPYRKSIFHNIPLILDILVLVAFSLYLALGPHLLFINGFITGFELFLPPEEFFDYRLLLLGLVAANGIICIFCETFVSDGLVKRLLKSKKETYDVLEKELLSKPAWPPVTDTTASSDKSNGVKEVSGSNDVVITGKGVSDPTNAFDSLFSTPVSISHSTAAVALNPPPASPRRDAPPFIDLKSSADSTPNKKAFSSAHSTPGQTDSSDNTSRFVSCDSILADTSDANR